MATILVADDDQLLRAIIRDHLERAGHAVLEAGDGIAAIDIALDERPDCLLLDVMMPLARGLEVVRRVRQEDEWHPTIGMISARTRVADRLNALDAGADVYFEKPFEPETLLAVIERHLRDAAPPRIVDVLGPLWTAVALERLARDAVTRRSTLVDTTRLEGVFADLLTASLGSGTPADRSPEADASMRLVWEEMLRALLRHAADQPVPAVTRPAIPDAWDALTRLAGNASLARQRAILTGRRPARERLESAWVGRLRDVLARDEATTELTRRVRGNLDEMLRTDDATGFSNLDPLQTLWLAIANRQLGPERVEEPA